MIRTAIIALSLTATTAAAGECRNRNDALDILHSAYGETVRSVGLMYTGYQIVEVLASDATGSWTILATNPEGVSCILASGSAYSESKIAPAGDPL